MLIILLLVGLSAFLLLTGLYQYITMEQRVVTERMTKYAQPVEPAGLTGAAVLAHEQPELKWREIVRYLGRFASLVPRVNNFDIKMAQAGIALKGAEFVVLSVGIAAFIALLVIILTGGKLHLGLIAGVGSYMMALAFVNIKIARRLAAFNNQLGDALSLMANSLRTGFSFLQAIEMLTREMPAPLSTEFARVLKEMNLGVPTEDALHSLLRRIHSYDLELVVNAVLIQRQTGGNLAKILDSISNTIRQRVMMKKEIQALTAQGRLSGWVVGLLPFGVGVAVSLINPEYMNLLLTDKLGPVLIGVGIVSQFMGVLFIRKIVNIDV